MKPFSTVAIPHKDILEGRFSMDVYAADLWEVFKKRAPDDYCDADLFFKKTYLTQGLKNLLHIAQKRLEGKGGDPVIQLQTPFGGGKTHALIALYHKAKEWKAKIAVIDGTSLDPKQTTIWEEIENQLTKKSKILKGRTSPGREKLRQVLEENQPFLILIDEILEYTTKAAGIRIGDTSLASQVLAFIQELTSTVKTLEKSLMVITLPSSALEHYDEASERMFQQIQKVVGRIERVYTPVQDEEVAHIIRRRLFTEVNEKEAKDIIDQFLSYAEREKMLPEGVDKATYRESFIKSFPFQPEVIDVLYKRWGSFPEFQRTRGVLRILALVVASLKNANIPFIRLGDFDLKNDDIRRELVKYPGLEYDSVIASDITSNDAGARKVDRELGNAYLPFSFGTKVATAIFMYSFSGGPDKGAGSNELKMSCADTSTPSSIISETVTKLREKLFYLSDFNLFFTNQPNLNRMLVTKMESVDQYRIKAEEKELIAGSLGRNFLDVYLLPADSKDVPDTKQWKLVVLADTEKREEIFESSGGRPRVYRNTIFFLCPDESERQSFEKCVKEKIAWELIEKDKTLNIKGEQKNEVKARVKKSQEQVKEAIRNLYRMLYVPCRLEVFKEINLGIPTYGKEISLNEEVYERLRNEGEILEKLSPLSIREKYLKDKDYASTKNVLESFYKTPGEIRIKEEEVFHRALQEGVKNGLFGLGILVEGKPVCRYFKRDCSVRMGEEEIILKPELCLAEYQVSEEQFQALMGRIRDCKTVYEVSQLEKEISGLPLSPEQKSRIEEEIKKKKEGESGIVAPVKGKFRSIRLKLNVPAGKLSEIARMANFIKQQFSQVVIKTEISASGGEISCSDYEDKIKEGIKQSNISVESEETIE